jgi:hypothetical protein
MGMHNSTSLSGDQSVFNTRYACDRELEPVRADARADTAIASAMIETALAVAAYHARRLARTMRLSAADREDAKQEIVITLLERWRYFNPARGTWRGFTNRVARQSVQAIADNLGAAYRRAAQASAEMDGEVWRERHTPLADGALLQWDLERFAATLPAELAVVARLMVDEEGEAGVAQQRSGLSSSEFFRRLDEIRRRLRSLGLVRRRLAAPAT